MILLRLFTLFFKINLLTPSGPASYGLTEKLTVPGLLTKEQFARIVTVSAGIPGSDAIQMAWQVGYTVARWPGALSAVFGALLPCILLVSLATALIDAFPQGATRNFLDGVRPALFFLLLIYAAQLITPVSQALDWKFLVIFTAAVLLFSQKVNPFIILVICGVIGLGLL